MADKATVTVAVLTFRRPDELRRVLPLLVEQASTVEPTARVLVIDNDPDAGAREYTSGWAERGVDYVHEPEPGIAAGRNRALDEAAGDDAIVFIDDDETPADGWLANLVARWRLDPRATAVSGPAIKTVEGSVDPWVLACGLFERWEFPTGTRVAGGATNNLLLDLGRLRDYGLRFDNRFGLTGGSDTMLLKALIRRGGEIVWCDEAQVWDPMPVHRLTREWVCRRYLRSGNTWVRVALALESTPVGRARARARLVVGGIANLARGVLLAGKGVALRRQAWRAKGTGQIFTAIGSLLGCGGYVYVEYVRPTTPEQ